MSKRIMKLLTIVIPVYKVEKYIRQCLDSVIVPREQADKVEVIVVNDGTPDNSGVIAHKYADRYPETIRVIDKENGGHGSAWNVGLQQATGKYIRFLDSDDWLSDLSGFLRVLEPVDADMVITHLNKYQEETGETATDRVRGVEYGKQYDISVFPQIEIGNTYKYAVYNFWYCTYRTDMLRSEHPLFAEGVSYDDAVLQLAPILLGETMVFLDKELYNYRLGRSGQSVDRAVMSRKIEDFIAVGRGLLALAKKYSDVEGGRKEQRDSMLTQWMKYRMGDASYLSYREYKEYMAKWYQDIKDVGYIRKSPKMRLYEKTPVMVSWSLFQLFNSYAGRKR